MTKDRGKVRNKSLIKPIFGYLIQISRRQSHKPSRRCISSRIEDCIYRKYRSNYNKPGIYKSFS